MDSEWSLLPESSVFLRLHTGERGLSKDEALRRIKEYGANTLPSVKPDSFFVIFLRQFQSPLIYTLLFACALVLFLGETIDGIIILAVLLFNATVGTIQEGRVQHTLIALERYAATTATVLRDGVPISILDTGLVPGDIIFLNEGEKVPADARLIEARMMKVDEASLTGESVPVQKTSEIPDVTHPTLSEERTMVFKGTYVVGGNGKAVVVHTGLLTEIGAIAKGVSMINTEIPLKTDIRRLSQGIVVVVLTMSAVLFGFGIFLGHSATQMFSTVVSLSVSVIPEGLPIVLTLVLATGVWRMSRRKALVKRLQAVEALGQARVIAVDKTGTLTKNELVLQKVWTDGTFFEISGVGYEPKGEVRVSQNIVPIANHPSLLLAGKIASFCANARVFFSDEDQRFLVVGDPTEAAMLVFGEKIGIRKDELLQESPFISEILFDYRLRYHATLHADQGSPYLTVVGAPEAVLDLCRYTWKDGRRHVFTPSFRDELTTIFTKMSEDGLRVLAFAMKSKAQSTLSPQTVHSLTFVGFFGMKDALREEVKESVQKALAASIRVVMITGDHGITARTIAKEAGIYRESDQILTGADLEGMSREELRNVLPQVSVFARVTPQHKLMIIKAYKERGDIIAMTGDGVNDALSLVAADLGVSMGIIGTEVAKEASDIVLLDDNFSSIVSAIEEGRSIYKTIKKVILYLFSTSVGEVLTIVGALFLGFPLPILAAQIIWLNFVTDGFLDVALAMDPKEDGLLNGNFEKPRKYLVDSLMLKRMLYMSLPMMIGTLFLFHQYIADDMAKAWTIALTTLAVFQWFNAWNCRSEDRSVFRTNPFSNLYLVGATLVVIIFQLFAVYHPFFQGFLHTTPLTPMEWVMIIPVAASILVVEEGRKYFSRRRSEAKVMA